MEGNLNTKMRRSDIKRIGSSDVMEMRYTIQMGIFILRAIGDGIISGIGSEYDDKGILSSPD